MKKKLIFTIAALIAVAALVSVVTRHVPQTVSAQDQQPPPVPDRISFGTIGITSGQTIRVSVTNTILPNDSGLPPGPTRVVMAFRYLNGNLVRNRSGEAIRKTVDVDRGDSVFIDLDYDQLPPGPVRVQVRPIVTVQIPPPTPDTNAIPYDSAVPSIEVINNANGRTQFSVFTHPAVLRGFNPQPDPPSPSE